MAFAPVGEGRAAALRAGGRRRLESAALGIAGGQGAGGCGRGRVSAEKRKRLFAPFPARGIWTSLDLTRAQFFLILLGSLAVFALAGGPLWSHARDSHFWRLLVSYVVIPPAVAWALWCNGRLRWLPLLVASAVIAVIKLVLTALMMVGVGIAV